MTKREEYIETVQRALDRLQVKASLPKLELRGLRRDLTRQYDHLHERLSELGDAAEEDWDDLRNSFDAAWKAFRRRFEEAMARYGDDSVQE